MPMRGAEEVLAAGEIIVDVGSDEKTKGEDP
jgi:hypothetical protein